MLGVLYVGPFEGVAAAAGVGLVGVEAEMGRQVLTDYLLCGRQRRDPWLIMLPGFGYPVLLYSNYDSCGLKR